MNTLPELKLSTKSHPNMRETGKGCFSNIISYLKNDSHINDRNKDVCPLIVPIANWLNDYCGDNQRRKLLPFVFRAIDSRTLDPDILLHRMGCLVIWVNRLREIIALCKSSKISQQAALSAMDIYKLEGDCHRTYDENPDSSYINITYYSTMASEYSIYVAGHAADAEEYFDKENKNIWGEMREEIIQAGMDFFDQALPSLGELDEAIIEKANELYDLQQAKRHSGI